MFELFIIVVLILCNGVFSMVEMAMVSSRRTRLEAQAIQGDAHAKQALLVLDQPNTFLSTIQIGITGIGILTGMFSGEYFKAMLTAWLDSFQWMSPYSEILATVVVLGSITYVTLVLGELVPKRLGLNNPEVIAKIAVGPMSLLSKAAYPFICLLNWSTSLLLQVLGVTKEDTPVTEEEIKAVISQGSEQGTIELVERQIMERVLHLSDRSITSLMTPRSEIQWISTDKSIKELKSFFRKQTVHHQLYPVSNGDLEDLQGIVYLKDILLAKDTVSLSELLRPAVFVLEYDSAYKVLEVFKLQQTHHAFVVNEFGHIEGLIALDDILEALLGTIPEPSDEGSILERADGSFLIDGQLPLYEFMRRFGDENESTSADTVAGFVLQQIGRLPTTGEQFVWRTYTVEVVDMDNQRIDKVLLTVNKKKRSRKKRLSTL